MCRICFAYFFNFPLSCFCVLVLFSDCEMRLNIAQLLALILFITEVKSCPYYGTINASFDSYSQIWESTTWIEFQMDRRPGVNPFVLI